MSDELRDLKEKYSNLSDDALLKILHVDFADYREEAIDIVKEELQKRNIDISIRSSQVAKTMQKQTVTCRRPKSLTIFSLIIILLFGGGYVYTIGSLLTGTHGLSFSRLIVEPPVENGGIAWPGWDEIGSMLKGEMDPIKSIPARYWWEKLKFKGSLLVGPLFIIGFIGVFIGRKWGRIFLYVYTAMWLANKVIYLILMGAEGVFKFSIAIGMAVLLILTLRSKSWTAWIEQKPLAH